jgi:hypothetical protein
MKIVKFSSPDWKDFGSENFGIIGQTPFNKGVWGNYKFEINNDCDECDFWIIYGSTQKKEIVHVPLGNTIFITSEEVEQKKYLSNYLSQFDSIITSRADLNSKNIIKNYYINAWFVRKTYNQLIDYNPNKNKWLSIISSDLTKLEGHKKRYAFVNKLIGHFKDKVDVYGKGHHFVFDKWDALADYKFSIAIENAVIPNYYTEKIVDCFLAETCPIYYGCSNIENFFSLNSLVHINIDDFKSSIIAIEETMNEAFYDAKKDFLLQSKNKILNELQFFPLITKILDTYFNKIDSSKKLKKIIKDEQYYISEKNLKDSFYQLKYSAKQYLSNRINF